MAKKSKCFLGGGGSPTLLQVLCSTGNKWLKMFNLSKDYSLDFQSQQQRSKTGRKRKRKGYSANDENEEISMETADIQQRSLTQFGEGFDIHTDQVNEK